ncbi:MAG: TonB-dependent receptor, partial [Candidatus Marinimicrobia bacterium]|nr:TonB-dependent receptor [Candidatus Neomarinimicrobiota bacterium]
MGIISKRSTISLIFSFAIILNAQETGAISGYVSTAETDEYLENVQVFIENSSVGDITNENGQFNITGLNPGTYIVKATMMGYSPKTAKVSVESGSAAVVFFELQPTILEAEEIFVTATKMNKTVKNIGGSVYLVEAAELRKSDSRNIEDILTRVPGVFTEDKFHNEHNVVSFRGVGLHTYVTRGILVLVDGISVNEAMGRSVFEGLNLENAERVEILKGPVSALYGPNGITGVINIVTKKAPDYLTGSVNITGGSFDTKRMAGRVGTRFGRYGINANALAYSTKGYMVRNA